MPHHVTNRERSYDGDGHLKVSSFTREAINAGSYILGGLAFVIGSLFFLPALEAYRALGAWLFVAGSLVYLAVTLHDLAEVVRHARKSSSTGQTLNLEMASTLLYALGSILFVVGSACFLPALEAHVPGAWAFIVGSLVFVVGATINVRLVTQAGTNLMLQLFNGIAILFMLGSSLFVVASIPYLWEGIGAPAEKTLRTYLAAEFIAASIVFLVAGGLNFYRAWAAHRFYRGGRGES